MKSVKIFEYAVLFVILAVVIIFSYKNAATVQEMERYNKKIIELSAQIEIITLKNKEFEDQISALQIVTENNTKSLATAAKTLEHTSNILKMHNEALNMHKESIKRIIAIIGGVRY